MPNIKWTQFYFFKELEMPYFYITLFIVALDQGSKLLVQKSMQLLQRIDLWNGWLALNYAQNTGAAFSLLQSRNILLIIITVAVFILVIFYRRQLLSYPRLFQLGLAVALGGAIGNFIDRVRLGYVVDFIDVSIYPAVFNVADTAIVVGVGLIVLGIGINEFGKKGRSVPAAEMPDQAGNSVVKEDE
jgi:signal peptidase II